MSTERSFTEAQTAQKPVNVHQVLVEIVSETCEVEPGKVGPGFSLGTGKLRTSLGRATLDARIRRRLGIKLENLAGLRTFGELETALAGNHVARPARAAASQNAQQDQKGYPLPKAPSATGAARVLQDSTGLACGVDLESVAALPDARDYWEEPFYRANFTGAEIAYCVSQPNPKLRFAARWCAKEALKKCRPEFLGVEMNRIEVVRGEAGLPYLQVVADSASRQLPVALSLTHTNDWALALVVSAPQQPTGHPAGLAAARPSGYRLALLLSLTALACSLFALLWVLIHKG